MPIILNSEEIKLLIPHRYPFLLIDKVLDINFEESIVAIKNLSINEEFFQGHFPNHPVTPGVLTIEICAQAAGILCSYSNLVSDIENKKEKIDLKNINNKLKDNFVFYLTTVDKTKFRNTMEPGDQLFIYVNVLQKSRMMWKFSAEIFVNDDKNKKGMETEFSAFIKSV